MASVAKKVSIKYRDGSGSIRTKHCGNAKGVRACITWLKREGLELIDKEVIDEGLINDASARKCKSR